MITSRKQFLKNAALLGAGAGLFKQNLFARNPVDDFVCELDCSFDLLNNNYPGIGNDIQMMEGIDGIKYGKSGTLYKDENFTNDCPPNSILCDTSSYDSNLVYYVYYPNLAAATYASCPLPAFIIAHGGGFSDCTAIGTGSSDPVRIICIEMAKLGYVSFSIEYRRGRILAPGAVSVQQLFGYYRGCQDYRGAIRSIIKSQVLFPTKYPFQIDVNNIFLGGISAGSFAALNAGYIQSQSMIEDILPGITAAMGNLDINLYYGGATIAYLPSVRSILNCWGNFYIGPDSSITSDIPGYFLDNNTYFPPAISFQGLNDHVAFPDIAGGLFPTNLQSNFRTDNCLTNNNNISSFTLPSRAIGTGNYNLYACGAKRTI